MGDLEVVTYRPEPAEFAWTFGGVPPVRTVEPGSVLELWTEDAFGGHVRGPDDLVSRVIEFPFVNPQTGPFHVEGAEPGDTLVVKILQLDFLDPSAPQMLLDAGLAGEKKIIVLQPRRVAARTVAARVAWERRCPLGAEVVAPGETEVGACLDQPYRRKVLAHKGE